MCVIFTYMDGSVTTESITVPGGGFVNSSDPRLGTKNLVLMRFFTITNAKGISTPNASLHAGYKQN